MELFVSNFAGKVKRITVNGREFLVAPLTLIVPGVLNGSRGPLYYPPEEISKNYSAWDGMPIVVNHPTTENGGNISARSPYVMKNFEIGRVYNAKVDPETGSLHAEGWFDVQDTKRVDNRIYSWLRQGKAIELSTGLFTDNEPARNGATDPRTKKAYKYIARNYRPDHLAILPDQKGACSLDDGCGVGIANAKKKGKKPRPSSGLEMTPDKACKIVKDGSVHGKPLTEKQRGMFGAKCGERVKNSFCPTGPGGGIDPTCGKGDSEGGRSVEDTKKDIAAVDKKWRNEEVRTRHPITEYQAQAVHGILTELGPSAKIEWTKREDREGATRFGFTYEGEDRTKAIKKWAKDHDLKVGLESAAETSSSGSVRRVTVVVGSESVSTKLSRTTAPSPQDRPSGSVPEDFYANLDSTLNGDTDMPLTAKQRKGIVSFLTTNCDCWKGEGDAEVLNEFDDDKLVALKEHAEEEATTKTVVNTLRNGLKIGELVLTVNAEGKMMMKDGEEECDVENGEKCEGMMKKKYAKNADHPAGDEDDEEDDDEEARAEKVAAQVKNYLSNLSPKEKLALLPPEMVSAVNNAMKIEKQTKAKIVARLTANVSDPERKRSLAAKLSAKPLDELQEMLDMIPVGAGVGNRGADDDDDTEVYYGAGGGPTGNRRAGSYNVDEDEDVLPIYNGEDETDTEDDE